MEFHDENEEDVQGRERDERDEEEVEEEENEEGDIMYEHDDRDYEDDEERGSENNVEDEIEHYSPQIYEDEEDDDERFHQTDKNIINVLKKLEEISTECGDIATYKQNTRNLFEQLLYKLEENNDQIYSLHHRVKYLEQECESKDIHIEKITIAMQEAVDDCRIEAEELVEDMSRKVASEVTQRHEVERIVCRLQVENSNLRETLRIQTLPGLEKNLDQLIAEIRQQESQSYHENIHRLQEIILTKDKEYQNLKLQREHEMKIMIDVIKSAQQKIETFQHQMKVHAQTLAMYREKEEKAKRSPVIFTHPPAPGSRELFVSESDTLSNPSSPKETTENKKKSFHDNGKAVVPYRKKNRGKRKGSKGSSGVSSSGEPQGEKASAPPPPQSRQEEPHPKVDPSPQQATPITPPTKNSKKRNSKKVKSPQKKLSADEPQLAPSMASSESSSLSPQSSTVTQSPKTQAAAIAAAAEHREKTSVFWSNIRLSL